MSIQWDGNVISILKDPRNQPGLYDPETGMNIIPTEIYGAKKKPNFLLIGGIAAVILFLIVKGR
jgi:hypothetical protein